MGNSDGIPELEGNCDGSSDGNADALGWYDGRSMMGIFRVEMVQPHFCRIGFV